jgi:hypothetical protein
VVFAVPTSGLVATNADLVRRLAHEVAPGQGAVVDLVGADDVIDSDGLAALLGLIADVRGFGGSVAIAARGALARQLRFVGIERLALLCPSASQAVSALTAPA